LIDKNVIKSHFEIFLTPVSRTGSQNGKRSSNYFLFNENKHEFFIAKVFRILSDVLLLCKPVREKLVIQGLE